MSSRLLKAVGLNSFNPGTDPGNNLYYWARDLQATNTPWLRLWVDFVALAPTAPPEGQPVNPAVDTQVPAGGGWSPAQYVAYLDFQVRAAKAAGFGVILTFWTYPDWVNGGTAIYGLPDEVGPNGPWAQYLLWVMTRYNAFNPDNQGGHCDILEICNETDLAISDPKRETAATTAGMMATAIGLKQTHELAAPLLAGPGHTDTDGFEEWMDWVLADLQALGYHGDASFAWTMHNYVDVATRTSARALAARAKLDAVWAGWPGGAPGKAGILTTEGGSLNLDRTRQRDDVLHAYDLWSSGTDGAGLLMFTQFLNVSSPVFDSGMRDANPYGPGGRKPQDAYPKRPLWRAWSEL